MATNAPNAAPRKAPKADQLWTPEQETEFLAQLAQGIGPHLAGPATLEMTASQIRGVASRDEGFRERYANARAEGRRFYRERLRAEARTRALADKSDRMLEVELATHVAEDDEDGPGYGHLRRDRGRIEATIRHEHELVIRLDRSAVEAMPLDELKAFRDKLAQLSAGEHEIIDAPARELASG